MDSLLAYLPLLNLLLVPLVPAIFKLHKWSLQITWRVKRLETHCKLEDPTV